MEQLNPVPPPFPMGRMPPMGAGMLPNAPTLGGMPIGTPAFQGPMRGAPGYSNEQEEKKK